jgi:hypothetical protein
MLTEHFVKRYFRMRGDEPRPVAGRHAGLPALSLARQRARARERVRAHRADVQLRTGQDRVRAGERAVPQARRAAEPIVETHGHPSSVSLDERLKDVEFEPHQLGAQGEPAATSRRRPSCCRSSGPPWAIASGSSALGGEVVAVATCRKTDGEMRVPDVAIDVPPGVTDRWSPREVFNALLDGIELSTIAAGCRRIIVNPPATSLAFVERRGYRRVNERCAGGWIEKTIG